MSTSTVRAVQLKDEGNQLFRQKDYKGALCKYSEALGDSNGNGMQVEASLLLLLTFAFARGVATRNGLRAPTKLRSGDFIPSAEGAWPLARRAEGHTGALRTSELRDCLPEEECAPPIEPGAAKESRRSELEGKL